MEEGIEVLTMRFRNHWIDRIRNGSMSSIQWIANSYYVIPFSVPIDVPIDSRWTSHTSSSIPAIEWLKTEIVSNVRFVVFHLRSIQTHFRYIVLQPTEPWPQMKWKSAGVKQFVSCDAAEPQIVWMNVIQLHVVAKNKILSIFFDDFFSSSGEWIFANWKIQGTYDAKTGKTQIGRNEGAEEKAGVAQPFTCHFCKVNSLPANEFPVVI